MTKEKTLESIVDAIFELNDPAISKDCREDIKQFITTTVNGDDPKRFLVINATLLNSSEGAVSYILTNKRLIKIDVPASGKELESFSYPLNTITGVKRKITEDTEEFNIAFSSASFGLTYSRTNKNIAEFFQYVDEFSRKFGE